jgi:hypothetical protein
MVRFKLWHAKQKSTVEIDRPFLFQEFMNLRYTSLFVVGFGLAFGGTVPVRAVESPKQAPVKSPAKVITPKGTTNFTSAATGFSIYLPVKPTIKRSVSKSEWGNLEVFTHEADSESISYIVMGIKNPMKVEKSTAAAYIDGVQEGFTEDSTVKLLKRQDVVFNGNPGRHLQISLLKGAVVSRVLIYVAGKNSYQIMAIGTKEEFPRHAAQIEKVLGSFRLTK